MKRHQPVAERQEHHERATTAAVIARMIRKATKPARLAFIAWESQRSDEEFADLVALIENARVALGRAHARRQQIATKRTLIELEAA